MKIIDFVKQEYIPSVDLQTLGNSFNTLEQGHQQAIKAASDLKIAIGALDMNEEENWWKEEKYNEIQNTIKNNTRFGNAYGALDDLVMQSGNLMSDKETLIKLQAQKDYKEYQAKIDASNLPQHYKNFYHKMNKYNGQDQYDEDGNIITNYKWQPKDEFVDYVDIYQIMKDAYTIAARDKGGTDITNDNGVIKTRVGNQWEILSEEDLRNAVTDAIYSRPGALESLRQDYKIAFNDFVEGDEASSVIDDYGNIMSEQGYIDHVINKFAADYKYEHRYTTSEYQVYPQQINTIGGNGSGSGNGAGIEYNSEDRPELGTIIQGMAKITTDTLADDAENAKGASDTAMKLIADNTNIRIQDMGSLINYVKQNNPKASIKGPGDALKYFYTMKNPNDGRTYGEIFDSNQKRDLLDYAHQWGAYQNAINKQSKALNDSEKAGIKFMQDVTNGRYNANSNIISKNIIENTNSLFNGTKSVMNYKADDIFDDTKVTIGESEAVDEINITMPNDMFDKFQKRYTGNIDNIITSNDGDDTTIKLFSSDRNNVAPIFSALMKANSDYSSLWNLGNLFTRAAGLGRDMYRFNVTDGEGNDLDYSKRQIIFSLANNYDYGIEQYNKAQETINKTTGNLHSIRETQESTIYRSAGEAYYTDLFNRGRISATDRDKEITRYNNLLKNSISNGELDLGRMYYINKDNNVTEFTNISGNIKLAEMLRQAARDDKLTYNWGEFAGIVDPNTGLTKSSVGYYVTFNVPEGADTDGTNVKAGQEIKVYLDKFMYEGLPIERYQNTKAIVDQQIRGIKIDRNNAEYLIPTNNILKTTSVKVNNQTGRYTIRFLGNSFDVNEETCKNFLHDIEDYKGLKNRYIAAMFNPNNNEREQEYTILNRDLTNLSSRINRNLFNGYGDTDFIKTQLDKYLDR